MNEGSVRDRAAKPDVTADDDTAGTAGTTAAATAATETAATAADTTAAAATTPAPTMSGLRERKKQRTRRVIFEAAFRLFAEHGYDGVTMAEIAHAADVAPATVFTHYASKEDLFYGLRTDMNDALRAAMHERPADPALTVVKDWLLATFADLLTPGMIDRSRTFARIILETPALSTRSSGFAAERQTTISALLRERMPGADQFVVDVAGAQVAAVVQTCFRYLHRDLAGGADPEAAMDHARARADLAFGHLAGGLDRTLDPKIRRPAEPRI